MQFGPGHQVVVPRLGQVAAGAVQLLLGVQRIEVDPLAAEDALLGGDHQRFSRSQRLLIRPQFADARQASAELAPQFDQGFAGLAFQFVLGLLHGAAGLAGGGRDATTGIQRHADFDADGVGVIALVVGVAAVGFLLAGAGIGRDTWQVPRAVALHFITRHFYGLALRGQVGVVGQRQFVPGVVVGRGQGEGGKSRVQRRQVIDVDALHTYQCAKLPQ